MKRNMAPLIFLMVFFLAPISREVLATGSEDEHEDQVHGHRHHIALFLGNTHAEGDDGFTVGLDYEYRLAPHVGVGGLADYAGNDLESTVVAAGLFIHPYDEWRLLLAPGFENRHGENEFLVRAGVSYEFSVGDWTVAPTLEVDLVDGEENTVLGLSIGFGF